MANPQQPELARSRRTEGLAPDSVETHVQAERRAASGEGSTGPIPEANMPGHHPAVEQDKPPIERFRARLRTAGSAVRPSGRTDRAPDAPDGAQPETGSDDEHPLVRLAGLGPRAAGSVLQKLRDRL